MTRRLEQIWYQPRHPLAWALAPFGWLFGLIVGARRGLYRTGLLRAYAIPVPVVVVGNVTVGGTGKTPLTAAIVERLVERGLAPGIASRGHGGRHLGGPPRSVRADSDPFEVGDEPVLLARHTGCPVVVSADRVAAARQLVAEHACDIVVCDDGLQHLRLRRDVEIVVVDGERGFGNGRLLPAGPLREGIPRLAAVDLVIHRDLRSEGAAFTVAPQCFVTLAGERLALDAYAGIEVDALAGIGHPRRFFDTLRSLGLEVREHPWPDHARFTAEALQDFGARPLLMTEKDAVKCERLGLPRACAYLVVTAQLNASAAAALDAIFDTVLPRLGR